MSIWVRRATIGGVMIGVFVMATGRLGERTSWVETQAIGELKMIRMEPAMSSTEPRGGYTFRIHPGVMRFAVVAIPARTGTYTRSFCIDDANTIFQSPAAVVPAVEAGRCVDRSRPLR